MKFERFHIHVKLLRLLFFKKSISIRSLEKELGTKAKYNTIRNILKQWNSEGIVIENKKDLLLLGGDLYEYSLTEKGIEYIKWMMSDQD